MKNREQKTEKKMQVIATLKTDIYLIDHGREYREQRSKIYLSEGFKRKKLLNKNW
jgi:hypothetical protein